jgi:hypothetical protein
VLHIRTADGIEIKLAETLVIENYLAKRFGLLGDNEWEEQLIKMLYSSSFFVRERTFMRVTWYDIPYSSLVLIDANRVTAYFGH